MANENEFVWLCHPDVAEPARFHVDAVDLWCARGWEPCDPPAEVDPTRAEQPVDEQPVEVDDEPVDRPVVDVFLPYDDAEPEVTDQPADAGAVTGDRTDG